MLKCFRKGNQTTSNSTPNPPCLLDPVRPKPHHSQGGFIANGTWASHSGQTTHMGGEPGRELHSSQSSQPDWPRDARLGFYMVSCVPKTNTSNMNSNKKAKKWWSLVEFYYSADRHNHNEYFTPSCTASLWGFKLVSVVNVWSQQLHKSCLFLSFFSPFNLRSIFEIVFTVII